MCVSSLRNYFFLAFFYPGKPIEALLTLETMQEHLGTEETILQRLILKIIHKYLLTSSTNILIFG